MFNIIILPFRSRSNQSSYTNIFLIGAHFEQVQ